MKKSIVILALCAMILPLQGKSLRIGTYNIRMSQLDKGDNVWSVRRERLKQSFKENNFDLCGLQEVSSQVQSEMAELTGPDYKAVFFSPYSQDGNGNKACGLIYNSKRLQLIDSHYFWPSETPDVMCVNDPYVWADGRRSKFKRGALCCTFKDLETKKELFFMVTHGCLNKDTNAAYAHSYIDMEKKYNPKGLPSFFVGDFNTQPGSVSSQLYRTYWTDCFIGTKKKKGPENTFNGFHLDREPNIRIDFIYVRGNATIKQYVCNDARYNGFFASDHFPVWVDANIK